MPETELLACPLTQCGGEALLVFAATGGAYIECQNCGLTTRVVDDELSDDENAKSVTALWNTRATPALPEERGPDGLTDHERELGEAWTRGYRNALENVATRKTPIAPLPDEAKQALGYFMRAYEGIAADSFDGIEERYSRLLQEGANRARHALGHDLPRLSDPLPDEEAVELIRTKLFGNLCHYRQRCINETDDARETLKFIRKHFASIPSTEGLREALEDCTGIESGPNGQGGMRVIVHYPVGREGTLFHLLSALLASPPNGMTEGEVEALPDRLERIAYELLNGAAAEDVLVAARKIAHHRRLTLRLIADADEEKARADATLPPGYVAVPMTVLEPFSRMAALVVRAGKAGVKWLGKDEVKPCAADYRRLHEALAASPYPPGGVEK
jgi:hypothetical protein